jgi:transposase
MDRVDARKLTVEGRRLLRQMVLRLRKQSGMTCAQLAAVAGVHVRTVEVWLKRARNEGEGSLEEKRRGRPIGFGRKLTMADEMWIRDCIIDHTPQQMKLGFALWNRPAIRALVRSRFGIELQDRLIGPACLGSAQTDHRCRHACRSARLPARPASVPGSW